MGKTIEKWRNVLALLLVFSWVLSGSVGCMTPEKAVRTADESGKRLAMAFWQHQTGRTNEFDISRPADALSLRLAMIASTNSEANIVFPKLPEITPVISNSVWVLSLSDALMIAARNDRQYQTLKEAVFTAALDLDYEQFKFETTFSGMILGALSGTPGDATAEGNAAAGASRKFENGSVLAGNLALDVAKLLQNDWQSAGFVGDLSMTVPLLRGSGRDIVREDLTQAEQNLIYAIHRFEYYRQTYAVTVASAYLNVLGYAQQLVNSVDNERNLRENSRRADMLFKAGRMKSIDVAKAQTELLTGSSKVVSTRNTYETRLDAFKLTIGLPPESRIELARIELTHLAEEIKQASLSTQGGGLFADDQAASEVALQNRHDLVVTRGQYVDSERKVKVAADALRADMTFVGTGKAGATEISADGDSSNSDSQSWSARLRFDMPWNRRRERNAYRKQLVAFEQAKRSLEEKEDVVKSSVRNGIRNVAAAAAAYKIQSAALAVAELRVESNRLFQQSGRSTMRDVLEAQSDLLTARNAFSSAMISWRISEMELRRDMGVLAIDSNGVLDLTIANVKDGAQNND